MEQVSGLLVIPPGPGWVPLLSTPNNELVCISQPWLCCVWSFAHQRMLGCRQACERVVQQQAPHWGLFLSSRCPTCVHACMHSGGGFWSGFNTLMMGAGGSKDRPHIQVSAAATCSSGRGQLPWLAFCSCLVLQGHGASRGALLPKAWPGFGTK